MREFAVVKDIKEDYVLLRKDRAEACASCSIKESCSAGVTSQEMEIKALKNGVNVSPGDFVEIEVPNFSATKLALLLYGIPLTVFITVLLVMVSLEFSEPISALAAFVAMVAFYAGLSFYDKKNRKKLMPLIIRKVSAKDVFTKIN
ncbi:SoxR reducing system RseC family protein [Kosmotoga pacifica]|uniref:Positive regulator of sigma E, RseC/MucC n=1 Tax=Kosmotoga pacifica TaxID=1330330 RepID=A0A0G2ZCU6_9BACT|nr:SoxR reducing system RseC family protein [Kosmotoga pacifica]AKI97931.1 positive regulator of sigma E, RseC/MucC [Kosmotoga pacifica]